MNPFSGKHLCAYLFELGLSEGGDLSGVRCDSLYQGLCAKLIHLLKVDIDLSLSLYVAIRESDAAFLQYIQCAGFSRR